MLSISTNKWVYCEKNAVYCEKEENAMKYEDLRYADKVLPVIFRKDRLGSSRRQIGAHWHEAIELIYVYEGKLTVKSDTRMEIAEAGEVACIHSNHLHTYSTNDESGYYCLILPRTLLEKAELFDCALPLVTDAPEVAERFRDIIRLMTERAPFYRQEALGQIYRLVAGLARLGGAQRRGKDRKMTETVKKAIEYIEAHSSEKITVEDVAAAVGVSRCHLCHIFRTATGNTVAQFWNGVRCDKARKMLRHGASVSLAAEQTGFGSLSHFTRVYKEYTGHTPGKEVRA